MEMLQQSVVCRVKHRPFFYVVLVLTSIGCSMVKPPPYLYEGQMRGTQVATPVTIVRDSQGIPHIFAEGGPDLFFGLGYVMAQDRLFQMDLYRHAAQGRLAEWFGNLPLGKGMRLVQLDMLLKLFDLQSRSRDGFSQLEGTNKAFLEWFTHGINTFIRDAQGKPSVEYRLLDLEAEFWSASDVLCIPELFGVALAMFGLGTEVLFVAMEHAVGVERALDFFQRYAGVKGSHHDNVHIGAPMDPEHDIELDRTDMSPISWGWLYNLVHAGLVFCRGVPYGSNNWVVGASRSASGKPLLANDPHVPLGLTPNFWYHAHLEGGGFSVAGLFYPGYPAVICGWNGKAAWGVTNIMADQIDLVRQRIDPQSPDHYLTPDGWRAAETRRAQCKVRWGRDRTYVVRTTIHGPLVPEEAMKNAYTRAYPWLRAPVSISYVATNPGRYFNGHVRLMQAEDSTQVKDALEQIAAGPTAFNYVWATAGGEIGYHAVGRIPIRADGQGCMPRNGWDRSSAWNGVIPFEDLPSLEHPEQGFILTANNRMAPPDYPWYITSDYVRPYRAIRIKELLEGQQSLSAEEMKHIQLDIYNQGAEKLLHVLKEAFLTHTGKEGSADPLVSEAFALLDQWDRRTSAQSGAAALFEVFLQCVLEKTFADEVGKDLASVLLVMNLIAAKVLDTIIDDPTNDWFDEKTTKEREDRNDIIHAAFQEAVKRSSRLMGRNCKGWSWGTIHSLQLGHAFGLIPFVGRSYRIATVPFPGDNDTVNAGYFVWSKGACRVVAGAASRCIVDLGRPQGAWFNCSSGMAGAPGSTYFKNLTFGWYRGDYFWTERPASPDEIPLGKRLILAP